MTATTTDENKCWYLRKEIHNTHLILAQYYEMMEKRKLENGLHCNQDINNTTKSLDIRC